MVDYPVELGEAFKFKHVGAWPESVWITDVDVGTHSAGHRVHQAMLSNGMILNVLVCSGYWYKSHVSLLTHKDVYISITSSRRMIQDSATDIPDWE